MTDVDKKKVDDELIWLHRTAELLDNKFRLPGTNFRFGVDAIVGLIPYIGDIITILVGGVLIIIMYRKGASGKLTIKMLSNVLIDTVIGTVPFIGDIFDFGYRSHSRNVYLMIEHYEEGRHRGSAWPAVILFALLLLFLITGFVYMLLMIISWLFA